MTEKTIKPYDRILPGADTAVLYLHGILGTPAQFDAFYPLAEGFSQYALLLDGHGEDARGLCRTRMNIWRRQVQSKVTELLCTHRQVLLAAHSMGTLFAVEEALRHPGQIGGLFLWDVPLKIRVRPALFRNCAKVFSGHIAANDAEALAAEQAYGIRQDYHIWRYAGWIPRYLELFAEIRAVRSHLSSLTVPTFAFPSARDEMVSPETAELLQKNPCIRVTVLPSSTHFYYAKEDMELLLSSFSSFLSRYA